jgi:hypothetical protein
MYLAFLLNVSLQETWIHSSVKTNEWSVYLRDRCRTCACRTCSKPMHYLFRNDASHINMWDAWFPNCPVYFGHLEHDDCCMLSGVWFCVSFIHDFDSVILLFSNTPILGVWSENSDPSTPHVDNSQVNSLILTVEWIPTCCITHSMTRPAATGNGMGGWVACGQRGYSLLSKTHEQRTGIGGARRGTWHRKTVNSLRRKTVKVA